jgi:RNA polymerase-binding transcription factor DksA
MSAHAIASDRDKQKYGQLLEAERSRLDRELADLAEKDHRQQNAGETGVPQDDDNNDSDEGTELFLREQDEGIRSSLERDLKNNEMARRKLEEGSYGLCDRCGCEIARIRLEELPSALFCKPCAEII